jgi:hypothetical protein
MEAEGDTIKEVQQEMWGSHEESNGVEVSRE